MSHIKSKDTSIEMMVRRRLFAMGYRYQVNYKALPGKPDIVFTKKRIAIFIHGCYWHGHDCGSRYAHTSQSNRAYWGPKIERTKQRDQEHIQELEALGWKVVVLWECQLRGDFEKTIWQGLNGPIWALIALDSGSYDIPKNPSAKTQATRQLYVNEILNNQLADGGWNLTGTGNSDPDMTAMALQALAKYQDQKSVQSATDKALTWLSKAQDSKGGYASWGTTNVESAAQVVVALCELGVSLDDSRFVKSGHTLTDNLLSFRQSNGGFYHVLDGSDGNNQMSAEQGFYALVAIDRAENGKNTLYRMGDVTKNTSKPASNVSKGNADASVKVPGVTAPGTTFTDIKNHANKAAIEELASRGIINGMGKGTFLPNKTMTRAEFAAIVTRALGLAAKDTKAFTDVPSSKWYAGYIGTANSSGIVNGVGSGKFNPDGTITRQEAAAMVARAAKLCGLDPSMDEAATKDMLAQFGDYRSVASWAKKPMAFCYSVNILDQSDLNIEPTKAILRCEIAQMLYNMLSAAELI